jgi:hypothetical protein
MRQLKRLEIPHSSKTIDLLLGDLAAIPPEHAVDLLALSAFRGDYTPTPSSLIGGLAAKGLSVARLAEVPEQDLRDSYSCWLSRPIGPLQAQLNFSRILCYEPREPESAAEHIGDIFRGLIPFVLGEPKVRSVAMPILAGGDMNQPVEEMLSALIGAGFNWLTRGVPVDTIKIVIRSDPRMDALTEHFDTLSRRFASPLLESAVSGVRKLRRLVLPGGEATAPMELPVEPPPSAVAAPAYDVFISYSRKDAEAANHLHKCLTDGPHKLKVFIDKHDIAVGAMWQQKIFDALDTCRATAVLYSPDFLVSKVCLEEFNIGWLRQREEQGTMFPLLVRDAALPAHMRLLNYVDCRVTDTTKISDAAATLVNTLKGGAP